MGMNDFQIGLTAGLDSTKSKQQLNADIEALKRQLGTIEIQAKIGKDTVSNLTKQLNSTQISLRNVNIDQASINKMVSQINTALSGININLGQNIGGNIQQQVQNSIGNSSQILNKFRQSLSNIGMGTSEIDAVINRINSLGVEIDALNQSMSRKNGAKSSRNILSVDVSGIDKLGQAVKLTEQYDVDTGALIKSLDSVSTAQQKATSSVENFADKQSRAITKVKNALASIQSDYTNQKQSRPIKDQNNIDDLNKQYKTVQDTIIDLGNADKSTFTQMQNNVDTEISKLKDMVKVARDAENVSTKMKGTDYKSGLNIAENDLEKFKQDAKDFPKITSTINELQSAFGKIADTSSLNEFNDKLRVARSELSKFKAEASANNRSNKVEINKSGLESQISNLENLSPEISKFKTQIAGADVTVQTLKDDLANIKTQGDFSVINAKVRAFTNSAKAAGYAVKEVSNVDFSKIKESLAVGDYDAKLTKLETSFKNLGYEEDQVTKKTESVKDALDKLKRSSDDELVENEKLFNTELKKSQNEVTELKSQLDKIYNPNRQIRLSNDILNWLSKNTKASRKAREELEKYYQELSSGKVSVERLNYINDQFKTLDSQQRSFGKLGKNLKDQFKQAVESFSQWVSVSSVMMAGVYKIKQAVAELKNLNDIITEISKTSDLTNKQLKELSSASFDTASKYGKTASDYLTGVQEMYRAGFDNAKQMSELSILAQSAGDMDTNNANDYLIATNAAYNYKGSVEELNKVLDSQNYITNNAAVSMQDMADATSEAASIASQYGVKVDELSSLIAVAVSKTRESGSEVGTALKALLINLQNTTSDPIKKAFEDVGISMTKMVGDSEQLKTPIELLKELSEVYNKLPEGDTKRANILNKIGGKHHANTLAAILSDQDAYNSIMDLYNSSSAVGSAKQEADKSANNWSGTLNKISNSWTELVSKFAESDSIITVLNLVNDLTQALGNLADASNSINKFFSGGIFGLDSSSLGGTLGNVVGLVQSLTGHGEKSTTYCAPCYKIMLNVA